MSLTTLLRPRATRAVLAVTLAAGALTLGATAPARADPPPERFTISKPTTGRLLNQPRLTSTVPINRRWDELSPAHQAQVRQLYENLPATDEPPFPKDGLLWIFTEFEKVQQKALEEGAVLLTVQVDAKGEPTSVKVYKSPTPDVAKAAAWLLMSEHYKPARCQGQPCAMDFLFDVTLGVNREVH